MATAPTIAVVTLHALAGIAWPLALYAQATGQPTPALTYEPALPPLDADGLQKVLDRDLEKARKPGSGALAPETGAGAVVGVVRHGVRRIFTYGTAKPDSIFEIGSISKTFTGLLLAQLVVQGKITLRDPVRGLLPAGTVPMPAGLEINLLDLATHHAGLPRMPDNIKPSDGANPFADYGASELYAFLSRHGVAKPKRTPFEYSNFGYSLRCETSVSANSSSAHEWMPGFLIGPQHLRKRARSPWKARSVRMEA